MKFLQLHTCSVLVAWPVQKDWFVAQLFYKSDLIVVGRSRMIKLVLMTFCIPFLPFLTGVFGCPTTVANVETVAVAPVCIEFLCPLVSCFDSSSDVPRQLPWDLLAIVLTCTYLYDNATKLMQYQRTEIPQRFSVRIILFIVIDLYFLFHRVLVKLLPRTTF